MRKESEAQQGHGLDKFKELRDEDDAAAVVDGVGVSGTVNGFKLARTAAAVVRVGAGAGKRRNAVVLYIRRVRTTTGRRRSGA